VGGGEGVRLCRNKQSGAISASFETASGLIPSLRHYRTIALLDLMRSAPQIVQSLFAFLSVHTRCLLGPPAAASSLRPAGDGGVVVDASSSGLLGRFVERSIVRTESRGRVQEGVSFSERKPLTVNTIDANALLPVTEPNISCPYGLVRTSLGAWLSGRLPTLHGELSKEEVACLWHAQGAMPVYPHASPAHAFSLLTFCPPISDSPSRQPRVGTLPLHVLLLAVVSQAFQVPQAFCPGCLTPASAV